MHQIDRNDYEYVKRLGYTPNGFVPCPRGENGKINPQVTQMYLGDNKFISVFHVKPIYYETLTGHWRPLSEVTSHHGNRRIIFTLDGFRKVHPRYVHWLQKRMDLINGTLSVGSVAISPYVKYIHDMVTVPKVGLTVTTVYPDPNVETTTVDGHVDYAPGSGNWDTVHDIGTGTSADDSSATFYLRNRKLSTSRYFMGRGFCLFDTSSIADTDTLSSATLSLMQSSTPSQGNSATYEYYSVCAGTPASNTALSTGDIDACTIDSPTEFIATGDRVALSGVTVDVYNDMPFNASGLSSVSVTGISKYCIRLGFDFEDVAPDTANTDLTTYGADTTGTTKDPKLAVTHTAGSTFTPKIMMIT